MERVVCFHLFNDYSGSPKVLQMVLNGLLEKGAKVDLVTSRGGVLDGLVGNTNVRFHTYRYAFSNNPLVTMARYVAVQVYTFLFALRYMFCRDCVFYINTLLPVGPDLAGWFMGKKVVYHYHENAFAKGWFYKILAWAMQRVADRIICVSAYQASFLKRKRGVTVIPNAVPRDFVAKLHPDAETAFERKTVLMLSSLKEYKGTREFIELAGRLPQYKFVLVINDTQEHIDEYLKNTSSKSVNLTIYPRQERVYQFYNESSIAVNLTDPRKAIETFGLTALEAMSAGLPVIVPTVGGIAEMVEDGVNGYKIDVHDIDRIVERIDNIFTDKSLYLKLSENALLMSKKYDETSMIDNILEILQ